jgi:hypothetical protein
MGSRELIGLMFSRFSDFYRRFDGIGFHRDMGRITRSSVRQNRETGVDSSAWENRLIGHRKIGRAARKMDGVRIRLGRPLGTMSHAKADRVSGQWSLGLAS